MGFMHMTMGVHNPSIHEHDKPSRASHPHICGHPSLGQFCTSLGRWGPLLVVHGTRVAPHHSIMAICNVGSHHDLGGVVRGWLIPHTCGHSQHLGNSAQVLQGGGPLLVVHGAWVAPHHSIMAICNVGSHHDLGGVVRGWLIPHTCGHHST